MIELREFVRDDIDRLLGWIDSERLLMQWAPVFVHPLDRAQLENHLAAAPDEPRRIFKVVEDGEVIGHAELGQIGRPPGRARVGRLFIAADKRGSGRGGRMLQALLHVAFDELDLARVDLGVADFNLPARRCYERLGFEHDGVRPDAVRVAGEPWTLIDMRLLHEDWRPDAV